MPESGQHDDSLPADLFTAPVREPHKHPGEETDYEGHIHF